MSVVSNLTILSLSCQINSFSPLFSIASSTFNHKISFQCAKFQNFYAQFYYSSQQNNNLYISSCAFLHFLDRAIQINKNQYYNKTFFNFFSPIREKYDETVIKNCIFCGIKSFHFKGGALLCFGHLKVKNSEFLKCMTHGYGIIASYSLISVENTVFYKVTSLFTSSIFSDSKHNETFLVKGNLFNRCNSEICLGIIYRPSFSDDFKYSYNNFSSISTKGDYGAIIINQSKTYFSYSIISNVEGPNYNSGIFIESNFFTKIESCIFCNLSRTSEDSNFGIALQIMINQNPSFISNCIFGEMLSFAPILFCSYNNILVDNSCFFQKRENIVFLPFFEFVNCTYDTYCYIENNIRLFTNFRKEIITETKSMNVTYNRNNLEYDLYLHFPFLLVLFFLILYYSRTVFVDLIIFCF